MSESFARSALSHGYTAPLWIKKSAKTRASPHGTRVIMGPHGLGFAVPLNCPVASCDLGISAVLTLTYM